MKGMQCRRCNVGEAMKGMQCRRCNVGDAMYWIQCKICYVGCRVQMQYKLSLLKWLTREKQVHLLLIQILRK